MSETLFDLDPTTCPDCGRSLEHGRCGWCDSAEATRRKEDGIDKALRKAATLKWQKAAEDWLWDLPAGHRFTSEELVDVIGLPVGREAAGKNNAVGALMNGIAKKGVIRNTQQYVKTSRPASHSRVVAVWERTLLGKDPNVHSSSPVPSPTHASTTPHGESTTPVASTVTSTDRDDRREWAVQRPSRGVHASVVRDAATFPRSIRSWAACVLDRESGGTLDRRTSGQGARNPSSSASGRWQFLDRSWRRGLSFMVRDRLVEHGLPRAQAREVRIWLGKRPISTWPGVYQDIGFLEVVSRGGKHHWNGGSHSC